jgi:hypothetical protein
VKQPPKSSEHQSRRLSKVRPVNIAEMRVPTAGITQRKFSKAQAEEYAANLDLDKLGIPIVNLRGGIYWILDGQHRVWALKANGFENDRIECEVYENLDDSEMADIFLGRDDRRPINPYEKFHVACTAERARELEIRRTVESQGLKVSKTRDPGCIGAVSALGSVYDKSGAVVLGQVLRTVRDAFCADPLAFDSQIIQGLGLVYNRYNGKTNEPAMVERLSKTQHGVRGVLRRAEAQRERTGNPKVQCIAATVVDIYNRGLNARDQRRLPLWWQNEEGA